MIVTRLTGSAPGTSKPAQRESSLAVMRRDAIDAGAEAVLAGGASVTRVTSFPDERPAG